MTLALTSSVDRASWLFAALTLVAMAVTIGAVALLIQTWRSGPADGRVGAAASWAAFAVAATCTGGSLWFSEVGGLTPCRLCWFQRICMYPLTVVTGVGALRRDRSASWYGLPLAVVGAGVSIYHLLLERFPSLQNSSGCDPLNPCSVVFFRRFGFISLPLMALVGFVTVGVLLVLAARRSTPSPRGALP